MDKRATSKHAPTSPPAECRVGIDHDELPECLDEVRTESCGNPIDTLERVVACRTTDLCRETTVSLR